MSPPDMPFFFIVLAGAAVVLFSVLRPRKKKDKLGIPGKLIYVDKGRETKPFFNNRYKVLGKPDLMYKQKIGILAVEYKSRNSNIYESDIVQAKAAALAARGKGFKVNRILVKTKTNEKYITLPLSDRMLYTQIQKYVEIAKTASQGKSQNAHPTRFKCMSCAYVGSCKFKV